MNSWVAKALRVLASIRPLASLLLSLALILQWMGSDGQQALFRHPVALAQQAQGIPYGGTHRSIPGAIQAEDYDLGGEGLAYHDIDASNLGGGYRREGVDIKDTADTGGGYAVSWLRAGEWLSYTVNVQQAGTYDIYVRVGALEAGRTFQIRFNGVNKAGPVAVPVMSALDQYQTVKISGVTLTAGVQVMSVVMGSLDFMDLNWIFIGSGGRVPYGGMPRTFPGRIEAEDYDAGGQGVAYYDLDASNLGGAYRSERVDIKSTADTGGGYAVSWFRAGEWLAYTVKVAQAGTYDIYVRVGSTLSGRTFRIWFNGVYKTGSVAVPVMPGSDQYQTVKISGVTLTAGIQVMAVVMGSRDYMDLNWIYIGSAGRVPYGGTPRAIPSRIEAEDYDTGGESVAYHDMDASNLGGVYRSEGVDIKRSADVGSAYAVSWFRGTEWLEYTVNVAQVGSYDIQVRVGSALLGRTFHISFNGVDKTGAVVVPQVSAGDQYQTVTIPGVALSAGIQTMRIVMGVDDEMDLNWVNITPTAAPAPPPPPPPSPTAPAPSTAGPRLRFAPAGYRMGGTLPERGER